MDPGGVKTLAVCGLVIRARAQQTPAHGHRVRTQKPPNEPPCPRKIQNFYFLVSTKTFEAIKITAISSVQKNRIPEYKIKYFNDIINNIH